MRFCGELDEIGIDKHDAMNSVRLETFKARAEAVSAEVHHFPPRTKRWLSCSIA